MDLSIGGIVRQVTAPVVDAVSLVRTGGIDQIASFLRDNPDQRGTIETALAGSGRTGDLSAIVERAVGTAGQAASQATTAATQVVDRAVVTAGPVVQGADRAPGIAAPAAQAASSAVGQAVGQVAGVAGEVIARPVAIAGEVVGRVGTNVAQAATAVGDTAARLVPGLGETPPRLGGTAATVSGPLGSAIAATVRNTLSGDLAARGPAGHATTGALAEVRSNLASATGIDSGRATPGLPGAADTGVQRLAEQLATAIRDGRVAQLIATAAHEGKLTDLIAAARGTGQLAPLVAAAVAAARTLDGVLAAFAGRGGLSATEVALFARAGLLSEADTRALRAAGVPVDLDVDEQATSQIAPRDGVAEERFDADAVPVDGTPVGGLADPMLLRFDAGAIRIASREAIDTYGVLGPPGGMVVAADAFEALLRAADGDLAHVERELGLEAGTFDDPDTVIAFVERGALLGLRLPELVTGAASTPNGVPTARADLGRGTPFSEMMVGGRSA